jgi:hypothetical protein
MAALVCSIIATWAWVDQQLGLLLVQVLGAEAAPAIAMYSVLKNPQVQELALDAAAKASLRDDQYDVFSAVLMVVESAQKERHKLAHWVWANCEEVPGALLLVDPKYLKRQHTKMHYVRSRMLAGRPLPPLSEGETREMFMPTQSTWVYQKTDLQHIDDELRDAATAVQWFGHYLNSAISDSVAIALGPPAVNSPATPSGALQQLLKLRRFREALEHIKAQKKTPHP